MLHMDTQRAIRDSVIDAWIEGIDKQMSERTKHQAFEAIEMHRREFHGAPFNPRSISPANKSRLKKGIKKHGLVDAIIVNKRTGNLVGGHQRLAAIDELEGTDDYTMTVQVIDVDENDEMALNMALNNPSLQGHFESDLQRQLFEHLASEGYDLADAGYTTTDVQTMFPDIFATGQLADQLEAESDIVNEIHAMAQVGKEFEGGFRERMGLDQPRDSGDGRGSKMPPVDPMPSDYDAEGGESAWSDIDDDAPDNLHNDSGSTLAKPASPDGKEWYGDKQYFKDERKRTVDVNAVKSDADVLLTFAFQTKEQREGFQKAFNLPEAKRYFDVHDVMGCFGVEL